jgi:hypothetical protein
MRRALRDQATGGQGEDPTYRCLSPGMPRIMHAYSPMEIVMTPETTHILIDHIHDNRQSHRAVMGIDASTRDPQSVLRDLQRLLSIGPAFPAPGGTKKLGHLL